MKHPQILLATAGSLALTLALGVSQAFAAASQQLQPKGTIDSSASGATSFGDLIANLGSRVLNIVFLIAGILAVLYLVYNGIQYITSAGNADKVKLARSGIINAVIGIIIIAAAYYIINFAVGLAGTANNEQSTVLKGTGVTAPINP